MPTERLAPDALLTQTGLTGALAAIDEDPDSPDGSWLTTSNNTATVCRVSFPTPTGNPTAGAAGQEFRVLLRKTNHSTNPTYTVELLENGAAVATLVGSTTLSSTAGVVVSAPWDASLLGTADGSLVECRVTGTPGGGSPGNRASVEVGAVEWNVTYTAPATYRDVAVAFTGTGTGATGWQRVRQRAAAFTGAGAVSAAWQRARLAAASFIGGATFTAAREPTGPVYRDVAVSFAGTATATTAWQRLRHRAATWVGGSALEAARQRVRQRAVALSGGAAFAARPESPGGGPPSWAPCNDMARIAAGARMMQFLLLGGR